MLCKLNRGEVLSCSEGRVCTQHIEMRWLVTREWGEEERRENCLIINTRKENRNNILSPIDNKITKFRGEKILCVQLLCDISLGPC